MSLTKQAERPASRAERERRQGLVLRALIDHRDAAYGALSFDAVCQRVDLPRRQVSAALRALSNQRLVDQMPTWKSKPGDWYVEWNIWFAVHLLERAD